MAEADPVGVVDSRCPPETFRQVHGPVEVERKNPNLIAEGAWAIRMPGEGPDRFSHEKELASYVLAGIAKSPGYHIRVSASHGDPDDASRGGSLYWPGFRCR